MMLSVTNKKQVKHHGVIHSSKGKFAKRVASFLLFAYTSIAIIIFVGTILGSFKTQADLITNLSGLPKAWTLDNYKKVLQEDKFVSAFINSVFLTLGGLLGNLFLAMTTAYGLSRFEFKGKGFLTKYFLVETMVPIQVSILPLFIILRYLGLLGKVPGLLLVYISQISFACLIFQGFFKGIPKELEEAALIDGAGRFYIFRSIIVPLSKPMIATVALMRGMAYWNDYFMPLILLATGKQKTLPVLLGEYVGQFVRYMSQSFAIMIVTLIPIVVLYLLFSKQMIEGLSAGAVKG